MNIDVLITNKTIDNIAKLKESVQTVESLLSTIENSLVARQQTEKGIDPTITQPLLGLLGLVNESSSSIREMEGRLLYALTTEVLRDALKDLSTSRKELLKQSLTLVKE